MDSGVRERVSSRLKDGGLFREACFIGGHWLPAAGATIADIRLLRATVGSDFGVKASGGIRTLADALAMLEAGANRLGTSASPAILGALPP